MRRPIAMGFYPHSALQLEQDVKNYLASKKQINALGVIVPHAGYIFSGLIAGKTLAAARTDKKSFVLFGPNHTGYGSDAALSREDWETPLGVVKNSKIVDKAIIVDETAHKYEHSLEVQLPFLQVLYKDFRIAPICLSRLSFERLLELSKKFNKDNFYITSSDFTHFGPMYGYEPVAGDVSDQLKWVEKIDSDLIDKICKLQAKEFYNSVVDNKYTVCGFVPITLLILIMKNIGAKKGELIEYKTSYDVRADNSFVSYAGIVFS